jgi:DNA adenine methylase
LINCYNVIKSNVEFLIQELYKKEKEYIKLEIDDRQAYFYNIRKDNLKLKEDFKEWRKN